jgi:hypothetical protein
VPLHPEALLEGRTAAKRGSTLITLDTKVEEIMNVPGILSYCIQKGVSLITCSDVFPGTLGKLLEIKRVRDPESFVDDLNKYLDSRTENELG